MNIRYIQRWLTYWHAAKMVDIDAILAFDQVHQARKYCACMRQGLFDPNLVTDLQIWRALERMRASDAAAQAAVGAHNVARTAILRSEQDAAHRLFALLDLIDLIEDEE